MSNSIDYNEKFKVLGNKIAKIRTETKNNIALSNAYLSRLNNIEEKAQKRINNLDKSFSTLKDQYLKLTSQYDTNSQYYKTQGQVNLFKNSSTKIKAQLQSQRENLSEFIDSTFETIEKVLNKKKVYDDNDIEQFSKEIDSYQKEIGIFSKTLSDKVDKEKIKIDTALNDIRGESGLEFGKVIEKIKAEQIIKEDNKKEFQANCKELMSKINEEFQKEEAKREDFEKNIFDLIEETCIKLTEDN